MPQQCVLYIRTYFFLGVSLTNNSNILPRDSHPSPAPLPLTAHCLLQYVSSAAKVEFPLPPPSYYLHLLYFEACAARGKNNTAVGVRFLTICVYRNNNGGFNVFRINPKVALYVIDLYMCIISRHPRRTYIIYTSIQINHIAPVIYII